MSCMLALLEHAADDGGGWLHTFPLASCQTRQQRECSATHLAFCISLREVAVYDRFFTQGTSLHLCERYL